MANINRYFRMAKKAALNGDSKEVKRRYRLGAIGIRSDGAIVCSNNIPTQLPEKNAHAEARLTRKLDYGAIVYVVRILSNGRLAMARPCKHCEGIMRVRGVKQCYYSISEEEYGVIRL